MDMESRNHLGDSWNCALCHRILPSENEGDEVGANAMSVCGDCTFLLLEDVESPDRRRGGTRRRFDSSESMGSMFSQQFSQMINLARQSPSTSNGNDDAHSADGVMRSRRWRRVSVLSDTESEGFDSLYGESESNASFRRYRAAHDSESDDALGLDSDSDSNNDNDIDPMNAGTFQWNSEDGESEWEEDEAEARASNWRPQIVGTFSLSMRQRIQAHTGDLLANLEESYVGNSGDYLDARGFEDLLDHLAENQSSRRGAPPASLSYVSNLPSLTIDGAGGGCGDCAICKETFTLGTVVNQLPCLHLYHPSCILPWLAARNTCPLCRYELPTDEKETLNEIVDEHHLIEHASLDDRYADVDADELSQLEVDAGAGEAPTNSRWLFLAAPIVSILGISLILWFGDSSAGRFCLTGRPPCRRDNNQRRWWSFF